DEARYDELTTRGEPAFASGVFKIRGVNPYAKAAIRSLQPFEVRKAGAFEEPMLSLLEELHMVDRQRAIPLCRLRRPGSRIRSRRPVRDLRFLWGRTLEDGDTLAEWAPTVPGGARECVVPPNSEVGWGGGPQAKPPPVMGSLGGGGPGGGEPWRSP